MKMMILKIKAYDGEQMSKPFTLGDVGYEGFPSFCYNNPGERDFIKPGVKFLFFIGLQDTNGQDIYSGDIIKFNGDGEYGVIEYSEGAYGYKLYWEGVEQFFPYIGERLYEGEEELDYIPFEVIGNIYENPDILENSFISKKDNDILRNIKGW